MTAQELVHEIKQAYKARNMRPTRDEFFYRTKPANYACPLTALALFRGAVKKGAPYLNLNFSGNPVYVWACAEFGEHFVNGFLCGVDGEEDGVFPPEYAEGYAAGSLVAQDLFGT
jgi:hypothetical protein